MVYITLIIAALLVGLDQIIKFWAINNLKGSAPMEFIKFGDKNIINLSFHENTGAAFSILSNKTWLLILVTSILLVIALYLLLTKRVKNNLCIWSIALIFSGGLGNLIDRIFRGFVVDYIEVKVFRFAIFNIADCLVVIGAILLVIAVLFFDNTNKSKKRMTTEELNAGIQEVIDITGDNNV